MSFNDFLLTFGRSFLFALATLVPILNPPAVAPIFLTLTEGADAQSRTLLAQRVSINIFIMLAVATFAGSLVLEFFGISVAIVRVGGGLLVVASAWGLLQATGVDAEHAQSMVRSYTRDQLRQKAFYPLTFPMICGPGALSAAVTVGATLHDQSLNESLPRLAGSIPAIVVAALIVYFCLRFAAQFLHKLGPNGTSVFMRLSAFILLCLGVQIIWTGVHELALQLIADAAQVH